MPRGRAETAPGSWAALARPRLRSLDRDKAEKYNATAKSDGSRSTVVSVCAWRDGAHGWVIGNRCTNGYPATISWGNPRTARAMMRSLKPTPVRGMLAPERGGGATQGFGQVALEQLDLAVEEDRDDRVS